MAKNVNIFYADQMMSPKATTARWAWQVLPCTATLVAGPLIAVAYALAKPEYGAEGRFSVAQALNGTLCLMMFLSLSLSRRLRLLEHRITRPLMFLAMYAVLTSMISPYPYENIVFAVKLIFSALVFVSAFHLAKDKLCSEKWLLTSTWIILFFMATSQVIGLVSGNIISRYKSDFATAGFIEQASVAASLIVSTLPVFLKFFPNVWSLAGIMIALVSLFFTMRRTGLIAAASAILLILLCYLNPFRRRIPWAKMALAVLILGVSVVISLRSQAGTDLLARMSDLNPSEGSGSGRYIFWRISLNHILNRGIDAQIVGEGMGSIRDVMYKHFGHEIGSHTPWLDLTHAFGVFGLIAIGWWYVELIRFAKYLRIIKDPAFQGVFSAIVIFFLVSLGQGGFASPAFALIYAALGFWASRVSYGSQTYYGCCISKRAM